LAAVNDQRHAGWLVGIFKTCETSTPAVASSLTSRLPKSSLRQRPDHLANLGPQARLLRQTAWFAPLPPEKYLEPAAEKGFNRVSARCSAETTRSTFAAADDED